MTSQIIPVSPIKSVMIWKKHHHYTRLVKLSLKNYFTFKVLILIYCGHGCCFLCLMSGRLVKPMCYNQPGMIIQSLIQPNNLNSNE